MWVQKSTNSSCGVKVVWRLLNTKVHNLKDSFLEFNGAGDWETHLTNYLKISVLPALTLFLMSLLPISIRETVPAPVWWELVILFTYIFMHIPCTPAYNHLPVVPPTVDEHVASYSVAPLARESLWCVTLLGWRFIPFHCQVIVRHFQFSMSRFGVQFKWLT